MMGTIAKVAAFALIGGLSVGAASPLPAAGTLPHGSGPAAFAAAQLHVDVVATGLSSPVFVTAPSGDPRLFVVEQTGTVRVIEDGSVLSQPFLDIDSLVDTGGERGLLGLAFPPDYAGSGLFYVNYTDNSGDTVIARYSVGGDPNRTDHGSAEILLTIGQPFSNHNGGHLAFGADGFLYIGLGDGGSGGDPGNRAQNDATFLGKMLRIDVSGGLGSGYSIPPSNRFAGGALPLPEIWSKGWRNPYRFSFDRVFGDMYVADVGQSSWEEVSVEAVNNAGGGNYGWRLMEGTNCFDPSTNCNPGGLTLPVHEYAHSGGRCSMTGGYVYRGSVDELFGHYLFADFCSNEVFSFRWNGGGGINQFRDRTAALQPPGGFQSITGFGEDGFGELYIVQFGGGTVFKVDGSTSPADPDPPAGPGLLKTKLANTGKIDGKRPKGVAKYRVTASGNTRLIVKLRKLPGATVALAACGSSFDLNVTGTGKAKLKLNMKKGDTVPGCAAGGTVQVTGVSGLDMSATWKRKK